MNNLSYRIFFLCLGSFFCFAVGITVGFTFTFKVSKISNFGFPAQFCGIKWKIILFLHKRKTVNFYDIFGAFYQ
jgi:hypothetical protein